jgi:phospholipid transport system substrate-binding protein
VALLLALVLGSAAAIQADPGGARAVVQGAADETLLILRDDALTTGQKQRRIERVANENFDFERMAKLALARSYKKLDAAQRVEFQQEFRRHLSLTYGRSIDAYSDEGIKIGDTREHKNGDVTVLGKVIGGKHNGATVDWRMRQRDDDWKAIDVIVEGVSMIANFRSQVQDIVKVKGPAALIVQLREKNDATESPTVNASAPAPSP